MSNEEKMMRKAFAFETVSEAYQNNIDSYDMYKLIGYLVRGILKQMEETTEHGDNKNGEDWYGNPLKHDCTGGYAE